MFVFDMMYRGGPKAGNQQDKAALESWIKEYPIYTLGRGISKRMGLGEILSSVEASVQPAGKDGRSDYFLKITIDAKKAEKSGWSKSEIVAALDKAVTSYIKTNFNTTGALKNTTAMNADVSEIDSPSSAILGFSRPSLGAFADSAEEGKSASAGNSISKEYVFFSGGRKK